MQIVADLHIHSKFSRATSINMDIEHINQGAKTKGLNLVGTGDFTHPVWFKALKTKLKDINNGLFLFDDIYFALTSEISLIYNQDNRLRKIHNILIAPSFEVVEQLNEQLSKKGKLSADGRPIFGKFTCPELVEMCMSISKDILIIPAHAWTPWFSVFGSKSGFDSVEECFQDKAKHIYALETGLSSDPAMNWRLSSLDKFALISNSDAHSFWPWRLGREANVFDFKEPSYKALFETIKEKDPKRFLYTIEVDPSYGKYHFDGHRNCKVSLEPKEAKKYNNICPVCKKTLTIGVLHRVEELADRPEGFVPKNAIPFKSLLPLYEIISFVLRIEQLYSKKVTEIQNKLIDRFGNELNVLLNVEKNEIEKVVGDKIAEAVIKNREGKIKVQPGYDGVYGTPVFNNKTISRKSPQSRLDKFTK